MGLGENECELSKFTRLELRDMQVKPAPRAETNGADARNQYQHQHDNGEPINNKRPTRQRSIIHNAQRGSSTDADREIDDLPEPKLIIQRKREGGLTNHGRAINERDTNEHQA